MLSILGLYTEYNNIFSKMAVPENVDKQLVIDNILAECAEVEILYPNPEFLEFIIGRWSEKEKPVWDKLYKTTAYDYEPIRNYDRTEEVTETAVTSGTKNANAETGESKTATVSRESSDSSSGNATQHTENGITGSDTEKVAGYNAVDFVNSKKVDSSRTEDRTVTENNSANTAITENVKNTESNNGTMKHTENSSGNETRTRSIRMFGNIGVTTTQQMINEERGVVKFNIIDYIVDSFKKRFCLLIY